MDSYNIISYSFKIADDVKRSDKLFNMLRSIVFPFSLIVNTSFLEHIEGK